MVGLEHRVGNALSVRYHQPMIRLPARVIQGSRQHPVKITRKKLSLMI